MPRVSVVIPAFNRAQNLQRAIDSVLIQHFKDFELIVVDDGSTDNTNEVVQSFGSRVRYLFQKNQGPGAARNTGVEHASGKWIAFLDSDDVWQPNKLARQVEWTEQMGADLCFHDVVREDEGASETQGAAWRRVPGLTPFRSGILDDSFKLLVEAAHVFLTTTLLLRRSTYLDAGGMSTDLLTNQDIDLYLRLFPRYRVAFLSEPLAVYSPGQNRAFEVASRKSQTGVEKGRARVQMDRIRSYARAFEDRAEHSDEAGAAVVKQGILRAIRGLAGLSRRNGGYAASIRAYSCYLALRTMPFANPVRLLAWHSFVRAQPLVVKPKQSL